MCVSTVGLGETSDGGKSFVMSNALFMKYSLRELANTAGSFIRASLIFYSRTLFSCLVCLPNSLFKICQTFLPLPFAPSIILTKNLALACLIVCVTLFPQPILRECLFFLLSICLCILMFRLTQPPLNVLVLCLYLCRDPESRLILLLWFCALDPLS